jgi:hypothetical protein
VVTFVADVDHTFNGSDENGSSLTLTATYHERAVFKLSGSQAGVYWRAQMTGSGAGRAMLSAQGSSTCTRSSDPWSAWSFVGQALVAIRNEAGRLFVLPRIRMEKVNSAFTGCGAADEAATRVAPVPVFYLGTVGSISGQTVLVQGDAQAVAGSQRFPIQMLALGVTARAGTATLSWRLTQHST